jgi:methylated-DNA-[protein]-cysteine S-methyltransferase
VNTRLFLSSVDSPIGPLGLAVDAERRLRGLSFGDELERTMRREYPDVEMRAGEVPVGVSDGLAAYFAGDLEALGRLTWSLDGARGGSGFQGRVWRMLADVPAGITISYAETARRAGDPGQDGAGKASAAQAAGVALNRNPLPLVLPCHRVVGADGSMTGFGGGLDRKTWLLRHEGALLI